MDQLRRVGVIVDIDEDLLAFFEAQQRAWELAVVKRRRDNMFRRQLDQTGRDAQAVVCRALYGVRRRLCAGGAREARSAAKERPCRAQFQKFTTLKRHPESKRTLIRRA